MVRPVSVPRDRFHGPLQQQATGVRRVVIRGRSRGVGSHSRCGDIVIHGRCSCHVVRHGRRDRRSLRAILAAALEEAGQQCHQDCKSNCANGHHGCSSTRDVTQKLGRSLDYLAAKCCACFPTFCTSPSKTETHKAGTPLHL